MRSAESEPNINKKGEKIMVATLKKVECPVFHGESFIVSKDNEYLRDRDFAHPIDAMIIKTLDNPVINKVFKSFVQVSIDATWGLNLAQGVHIDGSSSPEMYKIIRHCSRTLGIPIPYTIVTGSLPGINACTCGSEEFAFVAISSMIPTVYGKDEQTFILGHECGHLALGHVIYHTAASMFGNMAQLVPVVGPALSSAVTLPLNSWIRRSEISADRAGLICCENLETAKNTLLKLELGMAGVRLGENERINLNADQYVKTARQTLQRNVIGKYAEFLNSHPILPKRIEALDVFAQSEKYYRCTGKTIPKGVTLLTDDELFRRTEQIVKVME